MYRKMPQQSAQGVAPSTAPRYSAATEMSKAVDGLQKLSFVEPINRPPNRVSTIVEDNFTAVPNPNNSTAHLRSFKSGPRASPSNNATLAGQGNPTRAINGTGLNSSIFTNQVSANDRSTFDPHMTSSRMGRPNATAVSRTSAFTSSNWREAGRPAYQAQEKSRALPPPVVRHCTNRKLYPSHFYHPGMLLRAPLHEEDFTAATSTMTVEDPNKSVIQSVFGDPINTKERHMIVVACFARHYIAIPLFTHNGRGLINKKAEEYVSVRDHRDRSQDFQELSEHGSLTTSFLLDGIRLIDPKSTAHITYPISRKYDLKVVYEGELEAKAINHLVMLFNMFAPKAVPTPY